MGHIQQIATLFFLLILSISSVMYWAHSGPQSDVQTTTYMSFTQTENNVTHIGAWVSSPMASSNSEIGAVFTGGYAEIQPDLGIITLNLRSTGYLVNASGKYTMLDAKGFVVSVYPVGGDTAYLHELDASNVNLTVPINITNVTGIPFGVLGTGYQGKIVYYNGGSSSAVISGNITSVIPYGSGLYVALSGSPPELYFVQGNSASQVAELPWPAELLYAGKDFVLATPYSVYDHVELDPSGRPLIYIVYTNGTIAPDAPNISVKGATVIAMPSKAGADIYAEYSNGTAVLYLFNGTSIIELAHGVDRESSSGIEVLLPYTLSAGKLVLALEAKVPVNNMTVSGASAEAYVYGLVNGTLYNLGTENLPGIPVAALQSANGIQVFTDCISEFVLVPTPPYVYYFSTFLGRTYVNVTIPKPFNYTATLVHTGGTEYLKISWGKVNALEDVAVYIGVNGSGFKQFTVVPASTGTVYFEIPKYAVNISVYLSVFNTAGSITLPQKIIVIKVIRHTTTTTTTTTTKPPTTTTTTTTTTKPPTTTTTTTTKSVTPTASSTENPAEQSSSIFEIILILVIIIAIIGVVIYIRRRYYY